VLVGNDTNATATIAPAISTGTNQAIARTLVAGPLATNFRLAGRSAHEPIVSAAKTNGATHSAVALTVSNNEAAAPM